MELTITEHLFWGKWMRFIVSLCCTKKNVGLKSDGPRF